MGAFSMDKVAEIVRTKYGIHCEVSMTGGNIATIFAGETHLDEEGDERWSAIAGPGSFAWSADEESTGHTDEFFVGSDNNGESAPFDASTIGDEKWRRPTTEEEIALYIYAQTFADNIVAQIKDTIVGGFIPADVEDFSSLHDWVDANEFLIDVVPFGRDLYADGTEVGLDLTAYVQELVEIRIKAGEFLSVRPFGCTCAEPVKISRVNRANVELHDSRCATVAVKA